MPFVPLLTQAGAADIVNHAAGAIGQVEITEVGLTATAFTMASTLTALPGEFKRLPLSGDTLGDNVIHLQALDNSDDAYNYSGFGLYTATGVLFAAYGQAEPIVGKAAASASWIVLDIAVTPEQAAAINFGDTTFLDPPASTDGQGVVELATVAEAQAGIDALRALTPASARAAILGWLLAQDGAGSGIDADLLDGQQGSWYADIAGRLGFTPVRQGGGTGQLDNPVLLGWSGSRLKGQVDGSDLGNIVFDSTISDVWRASNDGSGSGLDADLWRGLTPAQFLAAQFPSGSNANGNWSMWPDGNGGFWLRQWGSGTTGYGYGEGADGWSASLTLPRAFADTASVQGRAWPTDLNVTGIDSDLVAAQLIDTATFRLGSEDQTRTVFWEFIGKGA